MFNPPFFTEKFLWCPDNELYHLPFQHRYTLGDSFVLKDNKFCRFANVNLYNYHTVWSFE